MTTDAERITRRETRLTEIAAEKATFTRTSSQDSSARDYRLLVREETQIREELAELRRRAQAGQERTETRTSLAQRYGWSVTDITDEMVDAVLGGLAGMKA